MRTFFHVRVWVYTPEYGSDDCRSFEVVFAGWKVQNLKCVVVVARPPLFIYSALCLTISFSKRSPWAGIKYAAEYQKPNLPVDQETMKFIYIVLTAPRSADHDELREHKIRKVTKQRMVGTQKNSSDEWFAWSDIRWRRIKPLDFDTLPVSDHVLLESFCIFVLKHHSISARTTTLVTVSKLGGGNLFWYLRIAVLQFDNVAKFTFPDEPRSRVLITLFYIFVVINNHFA